MKYSLLSGLGLTFALTFVGCGHPHPCFYPGMHDQPEGITVLGHGEAKGQPDVARINVGVDVRAGTAEQATQELNTRMAALVAAVKQAGVADKDVRTSNFSINFEQVPEAPPMPEPPPVRVAPGKAKPAPAAPPSEPPVKLPSGFYHASNTVELTIRDLNRATDVLSAATRAGANQVYGIQFELEDPSALEAQASAKAVSDAQARAQKLAAQAGVKLGRVIAINEASEGMPMPMQKAYAMRSDAAGASVPVERGELTVRATVQVVFALPHSPQRD